MTQKLEHVVRPFAATEVFTAKLLPPIQPDFTRKPDITVIIGKPIPLMMKPIGVHNLFGGVKLEEEARRTSTKRVFNPQDSGQFVDVSRIDYLKMRNNATDEVHEFNFNNPP